MSNRQSRVSNANNRRSRTGNTNEVQQQLHMRRWISQYFYHLMRELIRRRAPVNHIRWAQSAWIQSLN
jgi:hypothetical protein